MKPAAVRPVDVADERPWRTAGLFSYHYLTQRLPETAWWPDATASDAVFDVAHTLFVKNEVGLRKANAEDMGFDGPPFAWDEERRLHLKCQLDALFFHLHGLNHAAAAETLDTFPIVRRQDEARWGRFQTRELIVAYWNAYAAGNVAAWVKG